MFKKMILTLAMATTCEGFLAGSALADDIDRVGTSQEDRGEFRRGRRRQNKNRNSELPRDASIQTPSFSGSGCPSGSVGVALSPDKKTLSVLFDDYTVEAGESVGLRRDKKSCRIAVPFNVPRGMEVAVVQLEYRGFNSLANGAVSRFDSGFYFSDDPRGRRQARMLTRRSIRFNGPVDEDFIVSSDTDSRVQWSGCGGSRTLHIFNKMITATNEHMDDALSVVDSMDLESASSDYHLLWRRCRGRNLDSDHRERRRDRRVRRSRQQRERSRDRGRRSRDPYQDPRSVHGR